MCTIALLCSVAVGRNCGMAADRYEHAGEISGGVTPAGYHGAFADTSERYASGFERLCDGIKDCVRATRLRGYKRLQKKHRDLLYPECPPYCSPTFGYHHTQWKPFPDNCEYMWSTVPGQAIYEAAPPTAPPLILPLTPTPAPMPSSGVPEAPPAEQPYFPESGPLIQPADPGPAPAAPAVDPTAPPAPPPESDLDPAGETFLPVKPADDAAAFEEPALLQIN
jgi:hypothetical protein